MTLAEGERKGERRAVRRNGPRWLVMLRMVKCCQWHEEADTRDKKMCTHYTNSKPSSVNRLALCGLSAMPAFKKR